VRTAHRSACAAFPPHGNDDLGERVYTVSGGRRKWQWGKKN
jgi:hypothetical protein